MRSCLWFWNETEHRAATRAERGQIKSRAVRGDGTADVSQGTHRNASTDGGNSQTQSHTLFADASSSVTWRPLLVPVISCMVFPERCLWVWVGGAKGSHLRSFIQSALDRKECHYFCLWALFFLIITPVSILTTICDTFKDKLLHQTDQQCIRLVLKLFLSFLFDISKNCEGESKK